jgi:hypothetical protein
MLPNTLSEGPGKGAHGELLCRVSVQWTLDKEGAFAECQTVGTRRAGNECLEIRIILIRIR